LRDANRGCEKRWALREPIPWKAPACAKASTVHLGGTMEEIARSERDCWQNKISDRPYIILAQSSLFDPSRAPAGRHTAWAYCHVPNGCDADMSERIEAQIERFAPGFRDLILARSAKSPTQLQNENANLIGGNITGGANTLRQIIFRPTLRAYATPVKGLYLCSASTPPGGGVHGMCGYHAAMLAVGQAFPPVHSR
jgi:phytoene dehydrogenase-like protein